MPLTESIAPNGALIDHVTAGVPSGRARALVSVAVNALRSPAVALKGDGLTLTPIGGTIIEKLKH